MPTYHDDDARSDQSPAHGVVHGLMLIIPFWALLAVAIYLALR